MLTSFCCSKIYLAFARFKANVRSLPGDTALLPKEAVAGTEIERTQFAALLHQVSAVFEEGLEPEELEGAVREVARLQPLQSMTRNFVVYHHGSMIGISVWAGRGPAAGERLRVLFATEQEAVYWVQGAISAFHRPGSEIVH